MVSGATKLENGGDAKTLVRLSYTVNGTQGQLNYADSALLPGETQNLSLANHIERLDAGSYTIDFAAEAYFPSGQNKNLLVSNGCSSIVAVPVE